MRRKVHRTNTAVRLSSKGQKRGNTVTDTALLSRSKSLRRTAPPRKTCEWKEEYHKNPTSCKATEHTDKRSTLSECDQNHKQLETTIWWEVDPHLCRCRKRRTTRLRFCSELKFTFNAHRVRNPERNFPFLFGRLQAFEQKDNEAMQTQQNRILCFHQIQKCEWRLRALENQPREDHR